MSIRRAGQIVLLGALFCAALPAAADSLARIVRLSYLDGEVQIDRGAGRGFERAVLNLPLVQGAQLAAREDGSVEVEFEDGSTLRLVPNTSVVFQELGLRDSGQRVSRIELLEGTAYLETVSKKDDFTVVSAGQEIALPHPARFRISRRGTELKLAVFKGEVEVRAERGSVRVKKEETFTLLLDDPSQYRLLKGVDAESYDAWNQERDQYRQTYASSHHQGYNSQYSYGYSDLNYFGSFFQVASMGWLWRPYNVNPYWDPFADGAWMYYPGAGYMWVSAYPWGWMPYRYGSWLYVPGYGWCWRPGHAWNTWYAVPMVHQAPPGYVGPRPPAVVGKGPGFAPGTVVVGNGPMGSVRGDQFDRWTLEQQRRGMASPVRGVNPNPIPRPATAVSPAATAPAAATPAPAPGRPMSRRAEVEAETPGTKGTVVTKPNVAPAALPPPAPPPAMAPAPSPAPPVAAPVPHPAPAAAPAPTPTTPRSSPPPSSTKGGDRSSTSSGGSKSHSSSGSSKSSSGSSSSKGTSSDRK